VRVCATCRADFRTVSRFTRPFEHFARQEAAALAQADGFLGDVELHAVVPFGVPNKNGRVLIEADFETIERRVLASLGVPRRFLGTGRLSQSEPEWQRLPREGTRTGRIETNPEERRRRTVRKNARFGILYGQTARFATLDATTTAERLRDLDTALALSES
jgi:hypothetical protein